LTDFDEIFCECLSGLRHSDPVGPTRRVAQTEILRLQRAFLFLNGSYWLQKK